MKNPGIVIEKLQMSEKAAKLAEQRNQYFFRVRPDANKLEIKRAVEEIFKVAVARVNTMRYRGKKKRERTWRYGRKSDWKRAVVTLKEGSKIDLTS